jgi:benzil reductase ((S)-benzoin forming)
MSTQMNVVTVLTGCTRGLGLAMAQQLASEGGSLITLSRGDVPSLTEAAKAGQTELTQIAVDLGDGQALKVAAQSMRQAIARACTKGASAVRIIHNAGSVHPVAPADQQTDWDAINAAFNVNITAPIFLNAHFLQATTNAPDRRLMLISSGAGRNGTHGWDVYCATKAAMDRYAQVVSIEGHANTRVCSMAPGVIDTPMQETIRTTPLEKFPNRQRFEDMHAQGVLAQAPETARRLLAILQRDDFGQTVIDDVRNHSF